MKKLSLLLTLLAANPTLHASTLRMTTNAHIVASQMKHPQSAHSALFGLLVLGGTLLLVFVLVVTVHQLRKQPPKK
jgi:hypothetical protein